MTEPVEPVTAEDKRPYAPAANVVAVLERIRKVNLPATVDADLFRIAGVSEGAMGRVAYALRFLGLTDTGGHPSDRMRAIAGAPEEEWRDLLGGVVRDAYASDFARLDPAQDPQSRIVSAFKRYEPRSQTERMVMLFLGLCRAAGMPVLDAPRDRQMQTSRPIVSKPQPSPRAAGHVRRGSEPASRPPSPQIPDQTLPNVGGLLFGVTVEDIGALDPTDFTQVWNALGVIARARAASLRAAKEMSDATVMRRTEEADAGGE